MDGENQLFQGISPLPWHIDEDGAIVDSLGKLIMQAEQNAENANFIITATRVLSALHNWQIFFEKRELTEMSLDVLYTGQFNHGTDGHLVRSTVAHLVAFIEELAAGRTRL